MFEFVRHEIARTAGGYPAHDAAGLARVAETVREPILASGPSYLRESLLDHAAATVLGAGFALGYMALLVLLGLLAFYREWRTGLRGGHPIASAIASVGFFASCGALALALMADHVAKDQSREGYILTESRVIALDGKGGRTDIPATAIVGVVRSGDGPRITLQRAAGGSVVIEAPAADRAALDAAIERLAASKDAGGVLADVAKGG